MEIQYNIRRANIGKGTAVTILDPHLQRESREDKLGILDVMLETASGSAVNIEIQVERSPNIKKRLAYYKSKMITRQLKSARDYKQINKVICILITKYTVLPEEEYYHNKYCMINDRTGRRLSDLEEINILELSKVPKETDGSRMYDWMRFLKAERIEEFEMLAKKDPNIGNAVGVLKELSEDERMQLLADSIELAEMDRRVRLQYAVEEAVQQGLEQGVRRGLEQGIERGIERGIQQVVKNAHNMNMSIEDIIKLTGLSEEEIQEICS